jgi:hypothetical protein
MKWRRWAFVTLCLLTLIGLYSARRSMISWILSSRFSARIDSKSLETSFQDSSIEMLEARVELSNGQSIAAESIRAQVDLRTIWSGDLVIDQLQLDRVSIPAR